MLRYILFAVFLFVICACSTQTPADKKAANPKAPALIHQEISVKAAKNDSLHGMLMPPDLKDTVPKISARNIHLNPQIKQRIYPSSRYFDPVLTDSGQLAVACLRGIDVFDIDSHDAIRLVRSPDTPGHAWSVTAVNDNLWVADGYAGITVMDRGAKKIVTRLPELDNARYILQINDNCVLVCRHHSGAAIVLLETNQQPTSVCHLLQGTRVISACVSGNILYLGTIGEGYYAFDIINLASPKQLWVYQKPERITWCCLHNGVHYLLDRDDGIWALKDQGTEHPLFISKLRLADKSLHSRHRTKGVDCCAWKNVFSFPMAIPV